MSKSDSVMVAIGGGELSESEVVLDELLRLINRVKDPRLVVMTVATTDGEGASEKYNSLFRGRGLHHVEIVDVDQRSDTFSETSLKKIREADALYFTGGDQLNVTSLLGGSPLHNMLHERYREGLMIAGTSAGAAIMSSSMIKSGDSETPPMVSSVEIAPGMGLIEGTIIDTHFAQRGRHGRLLTAVAHYPQALGLGIDERTAMIVKGNEFKVVGDGIVTVIDGSLMDYCDLPYKNRNETIGMFNVRIHTLPKGYKYNLKRREPIAPAFSKMAEA